MAQILTIPNDYVTPILRQIYQENLKVEKMSMFLRVFHSTKC